MIKKKSAHADQRIPAVRLMGKHETGYERSPRDFYPTPAWVVDALGKHLGLDGLTVWEPACGDGRMVRALKGRGAKVICTDIARRSASIRRLDFLKGAVVACDMIITNPPFGPRGKLATAFIETGLHHITCQRAHTLALLLPADFDSAKTRTHLFGDCQWFYAKIVLTKRVVWFERTDGVREAPKENSAWFVWRNPIPWPGRGLRLLLYAP